MKTFKDYIKSVSDVSKNIASSAYEAGKQKAISGVDSIKQVPGKGKGATKRLFKNTKKSLKQAPKKSKEYTKGATKRLFKHTKESLLENFGPQQMIRLATNNSTIGNVINDILFSKKKKSKTPDIGESINDKEEEPDYEKDATFSDAVLNEINENLMSLEQTVNDGFKKLSSVTKGDNDSALRIERIMKTSISKSNQLTLPNLTKDDHDKAITKDDEKKADKFFLDQAKDISDIKKKLFEKVKDDKKSGLTPVERLQDMVNGGDNDSIEYRRRGRGKDKQPRKRRTVRSKTSKVSNPNIKYRSVTGNRGGGLLRQGLGRVAGVGKTVQQVSSTAGSAIAEQGASLLRGGASVATRALPALGGAGLAGGSAGAGVAASGGAGLAGGSAGAGAAASGGLAALAPLIAAIVAAVAGGGTGLHSLYKTVKGENPDNWISNLSNKGYQKVTGSKGNVGTDIYDLLHDETGNNKITKGFETVKDKTYRFFSGKKESKEYTDSKTKFKSVDGYENVSKQMSDKVDSTTNSFTEKVKNFDIEKTLTNFEHNEIMKDLKSNPNAFSSDNSYKIDTIPDSSADMVESHVINDIKEIKENSQQPIIVNPPSTTVPTSLPAGKGSGGEDSVPLVTRTYDNVLKSITNQMLFQSLN